MTAASLLPASPLSAAHLALGLLLGGWTLLFLFRIVLTWYPQIDLSRGWMRLIGGPTEPLLAPTRRQGLPRLPDLLQERLLSHGDPSPAEVRLAIGPEGGWSSAEEEAAQLAGWQPVSLGNAILRTSTAAITGLAWLALSSDQQG